LPAGRVQAPKGTFDVLPEEGGRRAALRRAADEVLSDYGVIDTPVFENTELFERGVGDTTDIVEKEMFTFEDQGGRSVSLRPEGTAGVCRAYLEHGMHKWPQPVKLRYWGPFFRYEAPQAGRYRQFTQVGIESVGSDDPSLDAEAILLLAELLDRAEVPWKLRLSSLGTADARRTYSDALRKHLRGREDQLSDDVRQRLDRNPLRAFDSDHPGTRAALEDAPLLTDFLSEEDRDHFSDVRELLEAEGLEFTVDPTLVRGLDYYTRTVFEFTSDALGAQSQVGGGGRYDGLVEMLGGPPTPGVGWAAGVERILLAGGIAPEQVSPTVFIAHAGDHARVAFRLLRELRANGVSASVEQAGRSLKGQFKQADRVGAAWVAIVADAGLELKDMSSGDQRSVTEAELLEAVR
jgi:histidyl-tRNA synthetase